MGQKDITTKDYMKEAARSHREARKAGERKELAKKPDSGEYLSGFYREDRLIPVITLAVYFGAGEWDGSMSLHEMLSVQNPEILSYVSDYKLNLIAPEHMSDEEEEKVDMCQALREMMEEANNEGMQKGALEKAKETAERMLQKGRFSYEEIAELTSLTVEEVQKLAEGVV